MRVAVYAVERSASWEIRISLELAVDLLWWSGGRRGSFGWADGQADGKEGLDRAGGLTDRKDSLEEAGRLAEREGGLNRNGRQAYRLVLLSSSLPLGWGVKLREGFVSSAGMRQWKEEDWKSYIAESLRNELREEERRGGRKVDDWLFSGEMAGDSLQDWAGASLRDYGGSRESSLPASPKDSVYGEMNWEVLAAAADRLAAALSGRSLLQNEMEALVAERLPELAEHWLAAAQLAYLQGRLRIEAAVGVTMGGEGRGRGKNHELKQGVRVRQGGHEEAEIGGSIRQEAYGVVENSGRMRQEAYKAASYDRRGRKCEAVKRAVDMDAGRGMDELGGRGAGTRLLPGSRFPQVTGWLLRAAALRLPLLRLARRGAAARRAKTPRCLRCGSVPTGRTACAACGLAGCAYCEACLALGRSRACALLLRSAPLPAVRCTAGVSPTVAARRWGLSAAQAAAAAAALGFLAEPRERSAARGPERFLLWAVTGAGKTEITFPLLEAALRAGGRALITTPRRDVVLELAPRLAKAFPADIPAVLYGGSEDRWSRSSITLATTHQLMRFHQAFDLVIIDELDAFPYHNDPMLAYAAKQVCKPCGSFIYLSATPPIELQRLARSGRLPHARVPVRFHGHPLPVPRHVHMPQLQRCLKQGRLPRSLLCALQRSLERKAQIFVFVPRIAHIPGLLQLLRRILPGVSMEGTSSKDPARAEKVLEFRSCTISLLVTTTILERGVTVPRSDVYILDADSRLFDEAALVQMAGRAGRSKDDPDGRVIFASAQWSRSQRGAISQIRSMNAIAGRQGYLNDQ